MTSTNVNPLEAAVSAFHKLDIDDQLAVLASLYSNIADTIPADVTDSLPTERPTDLLAQVQQLSPEEQLFALRDLLPAERTDQDEIMLDPNPAKANVELTRGGTTVPTGQYGEMSSEAKLAFWYMAAQRLGVNIIGIPADYRPSEQAIQVLNLLKSMNTDQIVAFLKQVL